MLKEERQEKILEILKNDTYVSVEKLARLLYVSLPTVRRDLSELAAKGIIVRSHGGAMRLDEGRFQLPLNFRNHHKMPEKQEMCRRAARLISNGDIVFIDASTSVMHIADFITAKNVTVVTNGMPAAMLLSENGIKTYFTGGEVLSASHGCAGSRAEDFASEFNYSLAFFSSYGISESGMIVDTSYEETRLRKAVFKNAEKKVFLYSSEKINLSAPYNVIPLSEVEIVITENPDQIAKGLHR